MDKAILVINSCTTIAQLQGAIRYVDLYCTQSQLGITQQLELIELLETKQKQLS